MLIICYLVQVLFVYEKKVFNTFGAQLFSGFIHIAFAIPYLYV